MAQQENDGFKQTTASGGETNIPFDFKIGDRAELKLVRTRAGTSETLVLNTDYTIADNQLNVDLGGVCVLIGSASPALAGDVYTALLNTPYSRGTLNLSSDFNQGGDFLANTLNTQFDYIVRMENRTARDVGKSLKFSETIDISSATISQAPIDGALLGFNGVSGEVVPRTLASLSLTGLDTTFSALSAGDSLVYNGTSWTNRKLLGPTGTSIASAATTDIGAANSDYIDVTGTTTITSFGTTTTRNHVWVNFTGILTITHNPTTLILPGNANIVTAVGDVGEFIRWTGGNWKCVSYQRKDGTILSDGAVSTAAKIVDGIITYAKMATAAFATTAEIISGTASKIVNAASLAPLYYGCSLYQSAGQSIPNATDTALAWNSETYDDNTWHDTVTNNSRITFNFSGRVFLTALINMNVSSGSTPYAYIRLNGATTIATAYGGYSFPLTADFVVANGDYIEIMVRQGSGAGATTVSGQYGTQVQVRRIK